MKKTSPRRHAKVALFLAICGLCLAFFVGLQRETRASDFGLSINTGNVALGVGTGRLGTSVWVNSGTYYRPYYPYARPYTPPPPRPYPYLPPPPPPHRGYYPPPPPPHHGPYPPPHGPYPGGPRF